MQRERDPSEEPLSFHSFKALKYTSSPPDRVFALLSTFVIIEIYAFSPEQQWSSAHFFVLHESSCGGCLHEYCQEKKSFFVGRVYFVEMYNAVSAKH